MSHKPIQFKDLNLIYPHKTHFQDFSGEINFGDRIALIGCNASGKSTLFKMLCGFCLATTGEIKSPHLEAINYD
jgi:ATPase subunit of ABC transporter with duplicated ATPase domains